MSDISVCSLLKQVRSIINNAGHLNGPINLNTAGYSDGPDNEAYTVLTQKEVSQIKEILLTAMEMLF